MDHDAILDFISGRREIMVGFAVMAEGLGAGLDSLWPTLIDMVDSGRIEVWDGAACLTPISAAMAGLASGPGGKWYRPGDRPGSAKPKAREGTVRESDLEGVTSLDDLPSDSSRPDQEAEAAEESDANPPERRGDYLSRPLQQPTRLHGSTSTWPLPGHRGDDGRPMPPQAVVGDRRDGGLARYVGPCSGCGGAEFTVADYCLACGRSGQDHLIPKPLPIREAKPAKPSKAARFKPRSRKSRAG